MLIGFSQPNIAFAGLFRPLSAPSVKDLSSERETEGESLKRWYIFRWMVQKSNILSLSLRPMDESSSLAEGARGTPQLNFSKKLSIFGNRYAILIPRNETKEGFRLNILLVDDERLNLDNLDYVLECVVPSAPRVGFYKASQALEYIQTHPVDVAFLDINMRGIDGITMAKILQDINPNVNIIFCTGYSEYAMDALDLNFSGYLMKPVTEDKVRKALENLRHPLEPEKRVKFRCFGNFEVFCDGAPIWFKYNRTKELLAYLVDRNGTSVSLKELSAVLFEDYMHRSYMYQIRLDLVSTLEQLGIDDILLQSRGYLGINKEKVSCDYYDYLDSKVPPPIQEYMTQYSFSEATFASIFLDSNQ